MKVSKLIHICVMGVIAVLLTPNNGLSQEATSANQPPPAEQEIPATAPDLADIVPLAAKLSGRLADLEKKIYAEKDISEHERNYDGIEADLNDLDAQLERLKSTKGFKYTKLVEIRQAVDNQNDTYEAVNAPLNKSIRQLGEWRNQWLAEKKQWSQWQSSLQEEEEFDELERTFRKANDTIDSAIDLILSRLEAMLTVQERAGNLQERISAFTIELDALIQDERRSTLLDESPPLLSMRFFSQFTSGELWSSMIKGLDDTSWLDRRIFAQKGWIVLLEGFIILFLIITIYRKRTVLKESDRWRFLAARPFSAGLFFGYMSTSIIYEYQAVPGLWKLANTMIAGISFSRLVAGLIEAPWKRHFINGLITILIITRLLDVLGIPLPIFRLYTFLASAVGLFFCLRMAKESTLSEKSVIYNWSLRFGALFFAVIIIAELWGQRALASHLFVSLIRSVAIILVFTLFMYMIRGGLEWLFKSSPLRRAALLQGDDTDTIIVRLSHFINIVIWGLVLLPAILMVWGVYDSLEDATRGLLALGFNLGSQRITVGLLIGVGGIVYGSFLVSWILQKLLVDEVLFKRRIEMGVRHSIARLAHYAVMLFGFLLALSTLGFEISKITILLSALGVGIGFGLQSIVNNFVSGLILLFERPVRVGDTIEIDGKWAEINRIGIRATTVQTLDRADLIIPNADLISNQVTNWTLRNRFARLIIPVGVAYGSNVSLVMETLMECAKSNPKVANHPPPKVLMLSFGESTLDFELRVIVRDFDDRIEVKSALHQEIDLRFREANITIAFPQMDLHLHGIKEAVNLKSLERNNHERLS
ncbi:MAG: mechanosensitive ion channel domain-containing protein [Desulfobacterales bacterium]